MRRTAFSLGLQVSNGNPHIGPRCTRWIKRLRAEHGVGDVVRDLQPDEQPAPVRVLAGRGEQVPVGDRDALGDVVDGLLAADEQRQLVAEDLAEQLGEELLLGGEVVVEAAEGDVRRGGDVADRRLLDALRCEQVARGGQDARAGRGAAPGVAVRGLGRRGRGCHAGKCTERTHKVEHLFSLLYGAAP